ncbi:hypothetical protein HCN44_008318 [Aphidius gifuensis]|uniref:GRIP domain-containing protein n=1 Tax=Aphidius gifuensis TaxID=684658 RepID=A0A835CNL6_APHGI|nr:GRIP and coiled-coil domain-containing protein 1 [Aphidius gifuensis]XP_044016585.1 GRIP and coiled-coil domain-containing protein 1 [Aphidius gifuensis]KAF7989644.1 hypothetical protein HCN44_008318 [Aphidius gifuensis]
MNSKTKGQLQSSSTNDNVQPEKEPKVQNQLNKEDTMRKTETPEELKTQLGVLMNSLAILSAEKSRMEANFQSDKKLLRNEREECEKTVKDLKEKLKRAQHNTQLEVEHVKYKLIMERHEREKEQADNSSMIKELQRIITDERRNKEILEQQIKDIKNQMVNKTQNKYLEAELEIANNKLKQAEAAVKETPPMLLSLQSELANLKKQYKNALHEERKRVANAEQQAKILEMSHESRVAGLESRLAELSETVGGYDRLRQNDQHAIQKLRDQLVDLKINEDKEQDTTTDINDPDIIKHKIRDLYCCLININNKNNSINIKDFLESLNLKDTNDDIDYQKKYELLQQEFDKYKQQYSNTVDRNNSLKLKNNNSNNNAQDNSSELNLRKSYCKNLEERIRVLNHDINNYENEYKKKLDQQMQQIQEERIRFERILTQKETDYRGKIATLEHQLLRQRERSLALIEDKEKEILTLKSSFHAILTKNNDPLNIERHKNDEKRTIEPSADFITALLSVESPPMLHYAQELARKDIQVSNLRKQNNELEADLRKNQRELLAASERHAKEIKNLESSITRLEAYKSREGANLEYLKNVIVNYLTSNDPSSRRHMMNAISTVLRFTNDEIDKIQRAK